VFFYLNIVKTITHQATPVITSFTITCATIMTFWVDTNFIFSIFPSQHNISVSFGNFFTSQSQEQQMDGVLKI